MTSGELYEIPFLRNIGIIITYKCQVACSHCIIKAGPNRKEEIPLADIFNWIHQISTYRNNHIKGLSLTGGEPFYDVEMLKKITAQGEKQGLVITVVTNAQWATTLEDATETLRTIPAIKMLAVSTDVHHQKFISFDYVKNAIQAANQCNLPYEVKICTEDENNSEYKDLLEKLYAVAKADSINKAVTLPVGRATRKKFNYQISDEPPKFACLAASSPVIFPNGKVIACCGALIDLPSEHPLILGNLRENSLQEILDKAELNTILHAIRIWGPAGLISEITEAGLDEYLPVNYVKDSICHACYELLSNQKIVEFLNQLVHTDEFKRKVAYARLYYLKEIEMVELLGS